MVELREQLGALLRLEVEYETRDYLLDLKFQNEGCDSTSSQNATCEESSDSATSQDQVAPSGDEILRSATATSEATEEEDDKYDASLPSRAATSSSNISVTTEQRAVSWREKICEWSYQGEQKDMQCYCHFVCGSGRERSLSNAVL